MLALLSHLELQKFRAHCVFKLKKGIQRVGGGRGGEHCASARTSARSPPPLNKGVLDVRKQKQRDVNRALWTRYPGRRA